MPLFGAVGLYNPFAVPAIPDQLYERAIRLHATEQTLKALFWKAVSDRDPRHSNLLNGHVKFTSSQVEVSSSFSKYESSSPIGNKDFFQKKRVEAGLRKGA
jgi:hypothetical protein